MKRSIFLKTLVAAVVGPKVLLSNNTTIKKEIKFQTPTKESYDGVKFNTYMADEVGQCDPKGMVDLWRRTGVLIYEK